MSTATELRGKLVMPCTIRQQHLVKEFSPAAAAELGSGESTRVLVAAPALAAPRNARLRKARRPLAVAPPLSGGGVKAHCARARANILRFVAGAHFPGMPCGGETRDATTLRYHPRGPT